LSLPILDHASSLLRSANKITHCHVKRARQALQDGDARPSSLRAGLNLGDISLGYLRPLRQRLQRIGLREPGTRHLALLVPVEHERVPIGRTL
jgi:hypothetical protein